MCWYMVEPRSNGYDDDTSCEEYRASVSDILLLPVVVVGLVLISITPMIVLFLYYLSDVYNTTKKTFQTGEIAYPFLAQVGIFVIIFWLCVFLYPPTDVDIHLIPITLIASVFVFNHTLLPYTAVFIYKLRRFFGTEVV